MAGTTGSANLVSALDQEEVQDHFVSHVPDETWSIAVRHRPSVTKSHPVMRRPAETIKHTARMLISSVKTRMRFVALKLVIPEVKIRIRVAKKFGSVLRK